MLRSHIVEPRRRPLRLAVLVDQQRAHALDELAVLEQAHAQAELDVERLLQRAERCALRIAASVSFSDLGDFCARVAAVFCAHSPGIAASAASIASTLSPAEDPVDVGATLGQRRRTPRRR